MRLKAAKLAGFESWESFTQQQSTPESLHSSIQKALEHEQVNGIQLGMEPGFLELLINGL